MDHANPNSSPFVFRLFVGSGAWFTRRPAPGCWAFRIEAVSTGEIVTEADGLEPGAKGERLELLSLVRGLEALEQPSQVQLATNSRYVMRGLRYGLQEWRTHQWRWECYGRWEPVKNQDLWKRVDGALRYHRVAIAQYRTDAPHTRQANPSPLRSHGHSSAAASAVPRPHFRIVRHNGLTDGSDAIVAAHNQSRRLPAGVPSCSL